MGIQLPPELSAAAAQAGVTWPEADEDQLRQQAQAWRDAGTKLTNLTRDADNTARTTLSSVTGSTGDAARRHWSTFVAPDTGHLTATARGCTAAADRLDHAAHQVGAAKLEIVRNLVSLAKNSDAAHNAAGAGHPTALLGLDTAIRATNANVTHITNSLATAVVPSTGVDMNTVQPLVNPNPGHHQGPLETVGALAAQTTQGATQVVADLPIAEPAGSGGGPGHPSVAHPDITGPVRIPPIDTGHVLPSLPLDAPTPPTGIPVGPGQTVQAGLAPGAILDPAAPAQVPPGAAAGLGGSAAGAPGQGLLATPGFAGGAAAGGGPPGGGASPALPAQAGSAGPARPAGGSFGGVLPPAGGSAPATPAPPGPGSPPAQGPRPSPAPIGGLPAPGGPAAPAPVGPGAPPPGGSGAPAPGGAGGQARQGPGGFGVPAPGEVGRPDGPQARGALTNAVPPGPQAPAQPQVAAPSVGPKERRDDGPLLFWMHMFPIGHMPVVSDRPARQLPTPPAEVDYAAGLRFVPGDHPEHGRVRATPDERRPAVAQDGLPQADPSVETLATGHDPLGGQHEREWDRRYLVRLGSVTAQGISSAGKEFAWPPGESYPEGGTAHGEPEILDEGTVVDRFGSPRGRVFSADGTEFARRSLPPDYLASGYRQYRVIRSLPVWRTVSAPWFGQPGGGERYRATYSAVELVALGYLEDITGGGA